MKFFRRLGMMIGMAALLLVPAVPAFAATDPFGEVCKVGGTGGSAACQVDGSDPLTGPGGTITRVTRLISFLAGAAAIIIIIVGGIMYITANGDASKISNAKDAVLYALIGLVIVVAAGGIITFVVNRL